MPPDVQAVRPPHRAARGRAAALAALAALASFALSARLSAHEVPADVAIHAFLKPEGTRLRLLVRAPLAAMRDVDFPLRGPGYLDLPRAEAALRHAAMLWIGNGVAIYEDGTRLPPPRLAALRVSLPSEQAFTSYEAALAHVTGPPLAPDTELYWNQGWLDVLLEYPIAADRSRLAIEPAFAHLGVRVVTALRFLPPDGGVRAFELHGDPGLVHLDPRWHQAALRFVGAGFRHILDGVDHLLFLACLVIPFRRLRALIVIVTAFTLAHSVTLVASAYDMAPDALWFPPLVEVLIAASIVYMGCENILGARFDRRWMVAFGFGLVHGFGFAFGLRELLQFSGSHLLTSLLAFNLGVELGQVLVLLVLVPALGLLFRLVPAERPAVILLSALVAHSGWHWMTERIHVLRQYTFTWPSLDAALLAALARWLMLAVALGGALWLLWRLAGGLGAGQPADAGKAAGEES